MGHLCGNSQYANRFEDLEDKSETRDPHHGRQ